MATIGARCSSDIIVADTEESTVEQIAKLYDRHQERTTRVQRLATA